MDIGIVGWERDETESLGLIGTAHRMGHRAELFMLEDLRLRASRAEATVEVNGAPVNRFDVLVCRAQLFHRTWQRDSEALALLSSLPVPVIDPYDVMVPAEGKVLAARRLAGAGLPIPETVTVADLDDVARALDRWHRVVLKPSYGHGGFDVIRLGFPGEPWRPAASALLDRYPILVCQPYLDMSAGDIRVAIAGSGLLHAFARVPRDGHWKANVLQGARRRPLDPDPELVDLAVTATRVLGLTISGCDIVVTPDGPVLLEVNPTPGWHSLSDPLRADTERKVIEHAVGLIEAAPESGDHELAHPA